MTQYNELLGHNAIDEIYTLIRKLNLTAEEHFNLTGEKKLDAWKATDKPLWLPPKKKAVIPPKPRKKQMVMEMLKENKPDYLIILKTDCSRQLLWRYKRELKKAGSYFL